MVNWKEWLCFFLMACSIMTMVCYDWYWRKTAYQIAADNTKILQKLETLETIYIMPTIIGASEYER